MNIVGVSQGNQSNNHNQGTHIQNQDQMNNTYQGSSYHIMGTFPPSTPKDDILKRLNEMENKLNNQGKSKVSYGSIYNESIHPSILIKDFPYKFEVFQMDKFKGK